MLKDINWPVISTKDKMIKTISCPLHSYRDVDGDENIPIWLFSLDSHSFKVVVPYIELPFKNIDEEKGEVIDILVAQVLSETEFTLFSSMDDIYLSANVYLLEDEICQEAFVRVINTIFSLLDHMYIQMSGSEEPNGDESLHEAQNSREEWDAKTCDRIIH